MAAVEFPFVLELLHPLKFTIKKMFGCTALYRGEKIVLIFRLKLDYADDNGVWIATVPEHHASLQKDFPSMRSIRLFGKGPTTWQVLPLEDLEFEASVERLCELVKSADPRIGKVSNRKRAPAKKKIQPVKRNFKRAKKTLLRSAR